MSDTAGWKGFKPDTTAVPDPVTPKKSSAELLDDLEDEISKLEDRRKELLFEVAREEVQDDQAGHEECYSAEEVQEAREEGDIETWDALCQFGCHRPSCCEGALAGTQKLHRLCTCGWNEVATEIERK
jgi:hypothetical protein